MTSVRRQGPLRLGVIGLSEGNGHPYSWSAICNGYDQEAMRDCPFRVIPEYLARQVFPRDRLSGVQVTHIWTQDRDVSAHVAAAALIPTVIDDPMAMIGEVDGVLLARDDAELHVSMSLPFLAAGLPIYIDKPIALRLDDLDRMYEAQRFPGQIFSCSALRYSASLRLDEETNEAVGKLRHVDAVVPKSWEKYGVHIVDPVLENVGLYGLPCQVSAHERHGVRVVTVQWDTVSATFTCLGELPGEIRIRYHGVLGFADRVFDDTFTSFRSALARFVDGVASGREFTTRAELSSVVSILEQGALDHA